MKNPASHAVLLKRALPGISSFTCSTAAQLSKVETYKFLYDSVAMHLLAKRSIFLTNLITVCLITRSVRGIAHGFLVFETEYNPCYTCYTSFVNTVHIPCLSV